MPSHIREAQPPQDIAMQITLGQWLVAASGGLIAARAGHLPDETEKEALAVLENALRAAADQESLVAISGQLGLVSAREAAYLIDAVGADAVPALHAMVEVLAHAAQGEIRDSEDQAFNRVRQLLLALSELRLAQARHQAEWSDPPEPWWPTTLSSAS